MISEALEYEISKLSRYEEIADIICTLRELASQVKALETDHRLSTKLLRLNDELVELGTNAVRGTDDFLENQLNYRRISSGVQYIHKLISLVKDLEDHAY